MGSGVWVLAPAWQIGSDQLMGIALLGNLAAQRGPAALMGPPFGAGPPLDGGKKDSRFVVVRPRPPLSLPPPCARWLPHLLSPDLCPPRAGAGAPPLFQDAAESLLPGPRQGGVVRGEVVE